MSKTTLWVSGALFKVGSKYVCWNSYASCWFLGPHRLSEIFDWSLAHRLFDKKSARIEYVKSLFPTAVIRDITSRTP
jgi:hypothetical protein